MRISLRFVFATMLGLLLASGQVWSAAAKEQKNEYPNATRKEPKLDMSSGNQKDLNKALELVNNNQYDEAMPLLQKVLDDSKASKYARALALEAKAQAESGKQDDASAVKDFRAAYDLDALPFPRWDLIGQKRARQVGGKLLVRPIGGAFPVLASRGCPEFCTYCPHRILAGHRERSVASIIEELEYLCDSHPNPYVIFRDPLFTQDRARCFALADEIVARGLKLRFECETRLDRLDESLLRSLHRAGLRAMSFGVESLDPATLKKAGRRPIPPEHQRAILSFCRSLGIKTAAFYVFGFLQDSWDSIAQTIDYAIQLGSTFAQFKILTPYPGTPLWKQMSHLVYEKNWEEFDGFTPTFSHPNLTTREMKFLLGAAYARFYVRPTFVANLLGIQSAPIRQVLRKLDTRVFAHQSQREIEAVSRAVSC